MNKIAAANDGTVWLCGNGMLDNVSLNENASAKKISVKHFLPLLINDENKTAWAINDLLIDR